MIDGRNFFDQPMKNNLKTYDKISKLATGQGDDQTTTCLVNYSYFESYYKFVAIDLSKQQKLDDHPKERQQINFTGNLDRTERSTFFLIFEEAKETFLSFSKETIKLLRFYLVLIKY